MIPKIIHFTVAKNPISTRQQEAIDLATRLHPGWEIKIWQDPVQLEDSLLAPYYSKTTSGAQLADLVRLDAIYCFGGIYLDSDVYLEKNLSPLTQRENFFCSEDGNVLTNAAFGATPQNSLIKKIIDELLENEPDWRLPPTVTTGPVLFARVLRWEKSLNLYPRETFYPYNWNEAALPPTPNTYGIHKWEGSWLPEKVNTSEHQKAKTLLNLKTRIKSQLKPIFNQVVSAIKRQIAPQPRAYNFGIDVIARTTRGLMMSLPGSDLSITPEIALTGTYEEPELRFLERVLKGGDFFIDVGCNVGVFTLVAARRVGPFGRVYAVDANPTVLTHLGRALVMNWLHDRTVVINAAIGDSDEKVELHFSEERLGDANIGLPQDSTYHRSADLLGSTRRISVRQERLDDIFPAPVEIKLLKVDVEGCEHKVLAGASTLIQHKCFQYIMLELLEEVSTSLHKLNLCAVENLMRAGYAPCYIDHDGNACRVESVSAALNFSRNVLFSRS